MATTQQEDYQKGMQLLADSAAIFESETARVNSATSEMELSVNQKKSELSLSVSVFLSSIQDRFKMTLFVSENGSDETGDGTQANPFKTLKKAQQNINYYTQYLELMCEGECELGGAVLELGEHQLVTKIESSNASNPAVIVRGIHEGSANYQVGGFLASHGVSPVLHIGGQVSIVNPVPTAVQTADFENKPLINDRYNALISRLGGFGPVSIGLSLIGCTVINPEGSLGVMMGGDQCVNQLAVNSVTTVGESLKGRYVAGYTDTSGTLVSSTNNVLSHIPLI